MTTAKDNSNPNEPGFGWREVSKDEFYAAINPTDASPDPRGRYPYVSYWHTSQRQLIGKSQSDTNYRPDGSTGHRYWLPETPNNSNA